MIKKRAEMMHKKKKGPNDMRIEEKRLENVKPRGSPQAFDAKKTFTRPARGNLL